MSGNDFPGLLIRQKETYTNIYMMLDCPMILVVEIPLPGNGPTTHFVSRKQVKGPSTTGFLIKI